MPESFRPPQILGRALQEPTFAIKNAPLGRGWYALSPYSLYPRARCTQGLDRAEQGFHFHFSISEDAWPVGKRTDYGQRLTGLLLPLRVTGRHSLSTVSALDTPEPGIKHTPLAPPLKSRIQT